MMSLFLVVGAIAIISGGITDITCSSIRLTSRLYVSSSQSLERRPQKASVTEVPAPIFHAESLIQFDGHSNFEIGESSLGGAASSGAAAGSIFQYENVINNGAQGSVHRIRDIVSNEQYALKVDKIPNGAYTKAVVSSPLPIPGVSEGGAFVSGGGSYEAGVYKLMNDILAVAEIPGTEICVPKVLCTGSFPGGYQAFVMDLLPANAVRMNKSGPLDARMFRDFARPSIKLTAFLMLNGVKPSDVEPFVVADSPQGPLYLIDFGGCSSYNYEDQFGAKWLSRNKLFLRDCYLGRLRDEHNSSTMDDVRGYVDDFAGLFAELPNTQANFMQVFLDFFQE